MNRLYKSLMVLQVAATFGGLAVSGQAAEPAQPAKPDLNRGQAIATQVCAACHAADGNSASPATTIDVPKPGRPAPRGACASSGTDASSR